MYSGSARGTLSALDRIFASLPGWALDQLHATAQASGAAPAKKRLVWLEGRGHNEVGLSREYWQRLAGFLDSVGGC
ncbi:unnamed protein product [Prorocentrum cordatum]|uniref:Peptidase S9 prolyl oligopeptidase catalytic domain-containing protein n=1 Tax=Prorocentrum cordatum TaxID=2364126 RepID=A0ABN9YGJ1_9DINO|nr:unnamed protein product [Polarella glacialis]